MLLNFKEEWLKKHNSFNTLNEIVQQPKILRQVIEQVKQYETKINQFINQNINHQTKIILTGAGTSEFVGNSIYNHFLKKGYDISSISSTDITTNPEEFFNPNLETVLVSFARSGNSPESVATYELVNKLGKKVKNIIITCNSDGQLAKKAQQDKNSLLFILPKEANDLGFAMTSSFSGMLVAFYLILEIDQLAENTIKIEKISHGVEENILKFYPLIETLAQKPFDRIAFLGSGSLKGYSQEAHLKVLELTAGEVVSYYNSPVGFRHGPKSIVNKNTLIFMMMNSDSYARQYDNDLLKEIYTDQQSGGIVALDYQNDENVKAMCNEYFDFNFEDETILLGLNYIVFVQLFAFYKSLMLNKTVDNPWPSGMVNRVVQGVIIHKYKK